MKNFFGFVGRKFILFLQDLSSLAYLFIETTVQSVALIRNRRKLREARLLEQVDEVGTQSLPLVLAVAALLGIALTVLISFQLKEMGG